MIFENKDAKSVDWKAFKMETFIEPPAVNWASLLLPFMMMIMIFTGLGIMQFKRKVDIQ
jgi:hypothetical protein